MGLAQYSFQNERSTPTRESYVPPMEIACLELKALVASTGRAAVENKQLDFLGGKKEGAVPLYSAGDLSVLNQTTVAIVGSRDASEFGQKRAARLAKELALSGITVSSGLAKGIDTSALSSAISNGGSVVAVIGTPLDKAYPAENKRLQEHIYSEHLLITPFEIGQRVFPSNFPQRNRVMALLSDATVIVEATDTSGTLHQAAECVRQNRLLFIAKSLVDNSDLSWPKKFLDQPGVHVLEKTSDIIDQL